jgi:hypothetical protein
MLNALFENGPRFAACEPPACGSDYASGLRRAHQPRQLGDVGRDPPRLVAGEQLGRRSPARLVLEIDAGEFLPAAVLQDEAGGQFYSLAMPECRFPPPWAAR